MNNTSWDCQISLNKRPFKIFSSWVIFFSSRDSVFFFVFMSFALLIKTVKKQTNYTKSINFFGSCDDRSNLFFLEQNKTKIIHYSFFLLACVFKCFFSFCSVFFFALIFAPVFFFFSEIQTQSLARWSGRQARSRRHFHACSRVSCINFCVTNFTHVCFNICHFLTISIVTQTVNKLNYIFKISWWNFIWIQVVRRLCFKALKTEPRDIDVCMYNNRNGVNLIFIICF